MDNQVVDEEESAAQNVVAGAAVGAQGPPPLQIGDAVVGAAVGAQDPPPLQFGDEYLCVGCWKKKTKKRKYLEAAALRDHCMSVHQTGGKFRCYHCPNYLKDFKARKQHEAEFHT